MLLSKLARFKMFNIKRTPSMTFNTAILLWFGIYNTYYATMSNGMGMNRKDRTRPHILLGNSPLSFCQSESASKTLHQASLSSSSSSTALPRTTADVASNVQQMPASSSNGSNKQVKPLKPLISEKIALEGGLDYRKDRYGGAIIDRQSILSIPTKDTDLFYKKLKYSLQYWKEHNFR